MQEQSTGSDMGKGDTVETKTDSGEVVLAPGDIEYWGIHHAEGDEAPQKIASERLSETVLHRAQDHLSKWGDDDKGNCFTVEQNKITAGKSIRRLDLRRRLNEDAPSLRKR